MNTLAQIEKNARANDALYEQAMRAYRASGAYVRPDYLPATGEINGHTVSAEFVRTTMANCLRSLRTAGTLRWKLNGKSIAFAKLVEIVKVAK